jgi:hypothetical protein
LSAISHEVFEPSSNNSRMAFLVSPGNAIVDAAVVAKENERLKTA